MNQRDYLQPHLNQIQWCYLICCSLSNHYHISIHYQIISSSQFLILFLQRHNPVLVVVGIREDTPLTKTSVCWKMRGAYSYLVLVTKSRKPRHKDHQGYAQYTTDYRKVCFHISLYSWRCIFSNPSCQPLRYTSHNLL